MNILITGGAGYIGSHVVKLLLENTDYDVTVIDNLMSGFESTINELKKIRNFDFIKADLSNWNEIQGIFKAKKFNAVMHFAADIVVSESVNNPVKYYLNNTANTINLVNLSNKYNVKRFVFSSTAAVYGEGKKIVDENDELNPYNPYGRSKLFSEWVIRDASAANSDFKYVILRYFNVAGASGDLSIGQQTKNSTSLIKVVAQTAAGKKDKVYIFGDDYPTVDGTGVRDYIHIMDLADAHIKALEYLENNQSDIFNVGYGKGTSVKEIIEIMKKISNKDFKCEIVARRPGDLDKLLAKNEKIIKKMKWKPKYDNLEFICKTAYEWEKKI